MTPSHPADYIHAHYRHHDEQGANADYHSKHYLFVSLVRFPARLHVRLDIVSVRYGLGVIYFQKSMIILIALLGNNSIYLFYERILCVFRAPSNV